MAKLNPKDFALTVAKDIQLMLKDLRRLHIDNSDVLETLETDQLFYLYDKKHKDFAFQVGAPDKKSKGQPTLFPVSYLPKNISSKEPFFLEVNMDGVIAHFNKWFNIIQEYNSVSFENDDEFLKMYEDEIFADFEIIEEDADVKPFDHNQQIILYKFLEAASLYLQQEYPNNEIVNEIVLEANFLREEIPILTKKVATRRFFKILAKIRKFNPITFKDVYDVAKKEVIKYLLLKGVETLPQLVVNITHFLGS